MHFKIKNDEDISSRVNNILDQHCPTLPPIATSTVTGFNVATQTFFRLI